MATVNIKDRRHPLYENNVNKWEFYMESFKGGDEYVEKYLYTHRLENPTDYNKRKDRAYFLNYCAPIASMPADFIFKKDATRPTDAFLSEFRLDVDRRGTSISEFMRRVCILSSIYGHVHILVDKPKPFPDLEQAMKEGKTTKLDNLSLRPYATIIHPHNLLDWSVDPETQELNWVVIYEEVYDDSDFMEERETIDHFKVWTRNEWIIYDADNNEIDRGIHGLGKIPLITCYHKDIDMDMIGESMLKDVAEANRAIFNWCSNIDEMISRQTFSQLICPDDGSLFSDEVDDKGQSSALRKVGSASIFTFPADSRHAPSFISPNTSQIDIIWKMVENHLNELLRMAGLISTKASLARMTQKTGAAQEMEFLDMSTFFANKAKRLEATENKLNSLVYLWLVEDIAKLERTRYPEKFDIISPQEVIDQFLKVTTQAISGTLNKELAKRLVYQVLPFAEDDIIARINDEIEENKYLEDPTLLYGGGQSTDIGNMPMDNTANKDNLVSKKDEGNTPKTVKQGPQPNFNIPQRRAKYRSPKNK